MIDRRRDGGNLRITLCLVPFRSRAQYVFGAKPQAISNDNNHPYTEYRERDMCQNHAQFEHIRDGLS
jgi:hypothetical protein